MLYCENPCPPFESGFPMWESHEPPYLLPPIDYEPVMFSQQSPVSSNSGSDRNSGSDERKRKRMISNRESARRSRMRKQKHIENMRDQLNQLEVSNRELTNRLRLVVDQNQLYRRENGFLQSEAVMLRERLWDIRQVLLVRQLQQQCFIMNHSSTT
ncbi:hypothetical protein ACJIZ3_002089 [Penstemon smallii]|uniref:BZIP domain-containing protein n=1 Tax=Penstemon smallii TaxID=265156 RepID=A0ABD3U5J6_9LAMI